MAVEFRGSVDGALAALAAHWTVDGGSLRNADGKIVVRTASANGTVTVRPLLGYEKAFERAVACLEDAGLERADGTVTLRWSRPAGGALIALCRVQAVGVEAELPGVLADTDVECLHRMRVAVRRTRSLLRELDGVLDPVSEERSRTDLRWVQAITGPLRDLDVHLEEWDSESLTPVGAVLRRRRAAALRALRAELRGERFADVWSCWNDVLGTTAAGPRADEPVGELATARVRSVHARMLRDGSAITDVSPAGALHDLRKRGKELRYLFELFGSLWPEDVVAPALRELKALQDVLGRFQDREVQADFLRGLAPAVARVSGGPEALLGLGRVIDGLDEDQLAARGEFADRFASFARVAVP